MAEPRLPNLIIAGVAKAGTTSMFNYLAQHPDVFASDVKETRYFDPLRFGEPVDPVQTYAAHFRDWGEQRYAVEATPGYFHGGRRIARAIRDTCPGARVLVILRSPPERCWSYFRFVKSRASVPKDMDFESYLDRCEDLYARGVDGLRQHRSYLGLAGGCYARWMGEWADVLGADLEVVYFDDLVADPAGTVRQVCAWLGLEVGVVDGFDLAVGNRTEQYRSKSVQRAALAVNRRAERFFRRHPTTKRLLRGGYYLVNREPSELSLPSAAAARMADFYRPHNGRLATQLQAIGVGLPPWLPAAR